MSVAKKVAKKKTYNFKGNVQAEELDELLRRFGSIQAALDYLMDLLRRGR